MIRFFLVMSFVGVLLLGAYRVLSPGTANPVEGVRASLAVADVLGGDAGSGFERALEPRPFRFPEDHGPHPGFRTEWWYLTGNLEGPGGEPYGFQFTLFRSAMPPVDDEGFGGEGVPGSLWRSSQLYMAHLAVTDGPGSTFHAFERFSRGAGGLAGSQADPFRAWIEDWALGGPEGESDASSGSGEGSLFPLELRAQEAGVGLEVNLLPVKPMVLQGDRGLSQKGPEEGNASYYYSFTRLDALGNLLLGTDTVAVTGNAWMDREWSTSALSSGQVGWDWFALQLDDGSDFMFYQFRLEDGGADPLSKGILVDASGEGVALAADQVRVDVSQRWASPLDGTTYPSGWEVRVPDQALVLSVTPLLRAQELNLTFRYWEGAVRVRGTRGGREIEGRGYVELTGYAESPLGSGARLRRR